MKRLLLLFIALSGTLASTSSNAAPVIDKELLRFARSGSTNASANTTVRVLALLESDRRVRAPHRYNGRDVVRFLHARSDQSFELVREHINRASASADIRLVRTYWINTSIAADVTPKGLRLLAQAPGVERIYYNHKAELDEPVSRRPATRADFARLAGDQWPYDLIDLGIDRLHAELPKVDGSGVVLGSVDTGVDGKHPALAGKIIAFFNQQTGRRGDPVDLSDHGTHTVGTMVGGDRKNAKFGVAPGAKMVATAALTTLDGIIEGMQYMLDPDGNPETPDFPKAINNSWNSGGAPDQEPFYRAIAAWEAAGILPVYSAGNAGPKPSTITKPHEYPGVIAVAATGSNSKVTSYSSRGPAIFRGEKVEKPDLSAPGDAIVSTLPRGRMGSMSGTSMAAPHATGTVALLLQVNPKLTPAQLRELLVKSTQYVDEAGTPTSQQIWTMTYGRGRLNAYNAVKLAIGTLRHQMRPMALPFSFENGASPLEWGRPVVNMDERDELLASNTLESEFVMNEKWVPASNVWTDF